MATVTVKLNTTEVPAKSVIVLGDSKHVKNLSQTQSDNKPPVVSTHHGISRTQESFEGTLVISQYVQSYDQEVFRRWNWGIINKLAELVGKNKVIVKLDGVDQTATQIRAMFNWSVVDNLNYLVEAPLDADVEGPAIEMGADGRLTMFIQVPSVSGSPNGLISLQGSLDGSKWVDIPAAFSELPSDTAGALTTLDIVCVWSGLNFRYVRLKYTSTSGGTGNTISAQVRSR